MVLIFHPFTRRTVLRLLRLNSCRLRSQSYMASQSTQPGFTDISLLWRVASAMPMAIQGSVTFFRFLLLGKSSRCIAKLVNVGQPLPKDLAKFTSKVVFECYLPKHRRLVFDWFIKKRLHQSRYRKIIVRGLIFDRF